MRLIGMLDSPYVRRVAISLQLLQLPFEHQSLSVFRTFREFREINPVVKAPTLVADDGTVLVESSLILEYAEALARPRSLLPGETHALLHDLRLAGLALVACERSVQIVYERGLRPAEKQHKPWIDRVTGQLLAAYAELERELERVPPVVTGAGLTQGALSAAVAWHFSQRMIPDVVPYADFPHVDALSDAAEALPAFRAAPHGDGIVARAG
jgi:glutathione S-transferase